MILGDASDLLTPYFKRDDYQEFEDRTPWLQELLKQIREAVKNMKIHPLGQKFIKVDNETVKAFQEFADICEEGLS